MNSNELQNIILDYHISLRHNNMGILLTPLKHNVHVKNEVDGYRDVHTIYLVSEESTTRYFDLCQRSRKGLGDEFLIDEIAPLSEILYFGE